jgi:hypothetical protein
MPWPVSLSRWERAAVRGVRTLSLMRGAGMDALLSDARYRRDSI